jgi:3-deoxy-D-arabino-heptulosonate 7-phosphate (DAHP) synthase
MQNYALLKALADQDKPFILKRGFSATLTELLVQR